MASSHRSRGRPKGPAHKFGPQTIYAAYRALRDHSPKKTPTEIARMTGEALYVAPTAHPHDKWIDVEFTFVSGKGPFRTKMLASGEAMVRACVEQMDGPVAIWRSRPCDPPPDLPKHEVIGNSAEAIATQARRLMKALGKR
jgi:hypothetical protein